jgi:hypothetical protein
VVLVLGKETKKVTVGLLLGDLVNELGELDITNGQSLNVVGGQGDFHAVVDLFSSEKKETRHR